MGATSVHCGSCAPAGGVSLPDRRDLTVRAQSPGMFSFEILMHCGSWGVLWGVVNPAGVMPACCPDDCVKGTATHGTHTHTHLWSMDTQHPSRILPLLKYIHRVHSHICVLIYTHPVTQRTDLYTNRRAEIPDAPAPHTGERWKTFTIHNKHQIKRWIS